MDVHEIMDEITYLEYLADEGYADKEKLDAVLKELDKCDDINPMLFDRAGDLLKKYGQYDKVLDYYNKAIKRGYAQANEDLGELYYEGNTPLGKDYKKAFEYFTLASKTGLEGDGTYESPYVDVHFDAKFNLAEMYLEGYYVGKDFNKFTEIINEIAKELDDLYEENAEYYCQFYYEERSKVTLQLGLICLENDDMNGWVDNTRMSADILLSHIITMGDEYDKDDLDTFDRTMDYLYDVVEKHNLTKMDLLDALHYVKTPIKLAFNYYGKKYYIDSSVDKDGQLTILFNKRMTFHSMTEMYEKAKIGKKKFSNIAGETYYWSAINKEIDKAKI